MVSILFGQLALVKRKKTNYATRLIHILTQNVSVAAKQLIASCLNTDPQYRITAKEALKSSNWLKLSDHLLENDLSASLSEMKMFNARTHLKSAAHAVMWSVRKKFKAADSMAFKKQMKEWNKDDEAKQRVDNALLSDHKPTLAFGDVYEMVQQIHTSNGAAIWSCKHKVRGDNFAVKIVEKKGAVTAGNKSVSEAIFHELAVLKSARHPKIMAVMDFFEEDDAFFLVMELMEGGDVFDRILSLQRYTEEDARDLIRFLLETVLHIHSKGIAHRDLKPQNLLLKVNTMTICLRHAISDEFAHLSLVINTVEREQRRYQGCRLWLRMSRAHASVVGEYLQLK